jgi:hypothetical protein
MHVWQAKAISTFKTSHASNLSYVKLSGATSFKTEQKLRGKPCSWIEGGLSDATDIIEWLHRRTEVEMKQHGLSPPFVTELRRNPKYQG